MDPCKDPDEIALAAFISKNRVDMAQLELLRNQGKTAEDLLKMLKIAQHLLEGRDAKRRSHDS